MAKRYPKATVIRYDGIVETEQQPLRGYEPVFVQKGNQGTVFVLRSGVGGNTVARAQARLGDFTGRLASGTHSDWIFTMFGINDALRSDPQKYVPARVFREQYRELIHTLQADVPEAKLYLMTATTNDQTIEDHVAATYALAADALRGRHRLRSVGYSGAV